MRIAHFADLHLDTAFTWAPSEHARLRRQNLMQTLERIVTATLEQEVDALFCGGDLFEHERISPDTERFLTSAFGELEAIPVFIAPGNHDWLGTRSAYARLEWTKNVHIFVADEFQPVELVDGITLWGAAHRQPAGTGDFFDGFQVDRPGVNLALFHGAERRGFPGSASEVHAPFEVESIERSGFDHAFIGHYHMPRHAEWHTYPGNPDPLTFGESGDRGLVIATVGADGSVRRETLQVTCSRVHDVEVDVTDCSDSSAIRELVVAELDGLDGAIRLAVVGGLDPEVELELVDVERAALSVVGVDAVLIDPSVRRTYDFDAIAEERTVRGQFVKDVRASDLTEDEQMRVLVTGLRALDGRSDLAVR